MEIKSPNKAWDLTTYWYRKYKIDKYKFDLKWLNNTYINVCCFCIDNKNEHSLNILHQTWSKGLLIPCHEAEDNKSLTRILPEGKSAHTGDPEIHLNS